MASLPAVGPDAGAAASLRLVHGDVEPGWIVQRFRVVVPGVYEFRARPLPEIGNETPAQGCDMNGWGVVLERVEDLPAT